MERGDRETIERITSARMSNNILWMQLLQIALDCAPDEAKRVLRSINDNDTTISCLLKELAR